MANYSYYVQCLEMTHTHCYLQHEVYDSSTVMKGHYADQVNAYLKGLPEQQVRRHTTE